MALDFNPDENQGFDPQLRLEFVKSIEKYEKNKEETVKRHYILVNVYFNY